MNSFGGNVNDRVSVRLVRKSLGTQLREALEARGLAVVIVNDAASLGANKYVIEGVRYSPV